MPNSTAAQLLETTISLINSNQPSPAVDLISRNNFIDLIFTSLSGASALSFVEVGETVYFAADDRTRGRELWKSDGTLAGTTLVRDINPGLSDSSPGNFAVVGNTLYFTANNGTNGFELWKSDGTEVGTVLVRDINLGPGSSDLSRFAIVNNTLYFSANDGIRGVELWKSDGTSDGTVLVQDINPGIASSTPTGITVLNGTIYFSANNGSNGFELWKSDGTAIGTNLVRDINPGSANSFPINLTVVDDTLFFSANNGVNGVELWKSDGTTTGTALVQDINLGIADSFPTQLINVNGRLYFTAGNGLQGRELWGSDGTAAGTTLVREILPGVASSYPDHFTSINGMFYFTTYDVANGAALWRSDGTATGTALVRTVDASLNAAPLPGLLNLGGTLYFTNSTSRDRINLWRSDGMTAGTVLAANWTAPPENIVFPAGAGVLNVKDFGAKGDGVTDDTAAIQAALNAFPNGGRIIYLPNGTYLISNTLSWPAGMLGSTDFKNTILQGQSQSGTTIRLRDNAIGFTSASTPKSMIFTGPAPAQRFRNSIRNLTVNTGVGNVGAIGVQFNASNQGTLRDVTIRSGDGQGVHGLDMNFTDEIGPLLVKNVTINGFQYGVRTGFNVNSQTFENLTLQNQSVYGFYNTGQVINIRGLTSTNSVTAVYNAGGRMTILDSSLNGTVGASTRPAIRSDFPQDLLIRNITTTGYQAAVQNASSTLVGPNITEFVSGTTSSLFPSSPSTLNLPIRETPDVPWDDPITTPWTNVVSFGAVPNDGIDDTAAIQAAIDAGSTTVYFPAGNYNIQGTVLVRNNVRRVLGTEATITVGTLTNLTHPGFKVVDGTNPIVVFERIQGGFLPNPTFENASSRTIVIRNSANVLGVMTGPGDVFLEDVVSNPSQSWVFNGQNVWARQFNVENQGTHITNNGGNLWIFGLKTERGGTLIDTRSGGRTELLGGFAYTTTAAPDGTQNAPMFIDNESSISISIAEINFGGGPNYTTYVREIRNGITRNLPSNDLPIYIGGGRQIPLYNGY